MSSSTRSPSKQTATPNGRTRSTSPGSVEEVAPALGVPKAPRAKTNGKQISHMVPPTVAPPVVSAEPQVVKPTHTMMVRLGKTADLGAPAIRSIAISSDGNMIALRCSDKTVRIWSNRNHQESTKLYMKYEVLHVDWMDDDVGVVVFDSAGIVSQWSRKGPKDWGWRKLIDASENMQGETGGAESVSFAYKGEKVAIAFPSSGVNLWIWTRGMWARQRSIPKQHVTALRFVDDGNGLLGGTKDGALWHCPVPNGNLRALAFFPSMSRITKLDVAVSKKHALLTIEPGPSALVDLDKDSSTDSALSLETSYSGPSSGTKVSHGGPAMGFVSADGHAVVSGLLGKNALVWVRGDVAAILDHGGDTVLAVCCHASGNIRVTGDRYMVTGTEEGRLSWWALSW
ncbi:hypothetical protein BDV98DRAFT_568388 [Pterulicium gracile]|uniref:WD40-repeat-containing domain protein n=1 Tax=Pterulicium gracile TaxID=1884261 RepID=A0A5C3QH32_9AGAR|nr:hypothetical protein BDV98DRAFT_568388 [Pterula gracilis]